MSFEFPWDQLKAETMRSVSRDLGLTVTNANRKREDQVAFFKEVTELGREYNK